MKCDKCNKEFNSNVNERILSGVSFELHDGEVITLCAGCLNKLGKLDEKGKDTFFRELGY